MTLHERLEEAFDKRVGGTAMLPASDLLSAMTRIEQLSAAQADNEQLVNALEYYANTTYDVFTSVARNAIAAHKARKEK